MTNAPLMPKATAVWLLDNTALTFDQVADFTKMHPLEIRAIADGDAAQGIKGSDPIASGQLTREEIEKGEKDPEHRLKLEESKVILPPAAKKKGPRYTPVSRRHERPSAILWLVRNHPELKDAQIMRLVGTTKTTIASVRDRTHWNASTLTPMDPVTLGLCSQIELDFEVQRAAKEKPIDTQYGGATLLPASETTRKEVELETAGEEEQRRSQCRCRVRQAEDHRRQEAGRGVGASKRTPTQPNIPSSLRGAKRRSNPCFSARGAMDCFASLAMTNPHDSASPRRAFASELCLSER